MKWKTLQECYEEAGCQFPFEVSCMHESWDLTKSSPHLKITGRSDRGWENAASFWAGCPGPYFVLADHQKRVSDFDEFLENSRRGIVV